MVVFKPLGILSLINLFYLISADDFMETSIGNVIKGCWDRNLIPYYIFKVGFSEGQLNYLRKQIEFFNTKTCLSWINIDDFEEIRNSTRFVQFQYDPKIDSTCYTYKKLYKRERAANRFLVHVQLAQHCFTDRTVIHELLHVLGFHHEHQRADRDCYVDIDKNEVPNREYKKIRQPWLERFPYDKMSEMHYYRTNKMRAKTERNFDEETLGRRGVLSDLDLWKVQYKFCGREHFCDSDDYGRHCGVMEEFEKMSGCVS